MIYTTFRLLRESGISPERYRLLVRELGPVQTYGRDTPIQISQIMSLPAFALRDVLWLFRVVPEEQREQADRVARTLICRCIRETPLHDGRTVWDLLTDERSRQAVITAEAYLEGKATRQELDAAGEAAMEAAEAISFSTHGASFLAPITAVGDAVFAVEAALVGIIDVVGNHAAWDAVDAAEDGTDVDVVWDVADVDTRVAAKQVLSGIVVELVQLTAAAVERNDDG